MALAVVVGILLALVDAARAGTYVVVGCSGEAPTDAVWVGSNDGVVRPESTCAPGAGSGGSSGARLGALVPAGSTLPGQGDGGWRFVAPAGVTLTGVSATVQRQLGFQGIVEQVGTVDSAGAFHALEQLDGTSATSSPLELELRPPAPGFESRLTCMSQEVASCRLRMAVFTQLTRLRLTLADGAAPTMDVGGDLAAPGWKRGDVAAAFVAHDVGSGLAGGEVRVDGVPVGPVSFGCRRAAEGAERVGTRLQPCPVEATSSVTVRTAGIADGVHGLSACATDFSGNATCSAPRSISIDNTPPELAFAAVDDERRVAVGVSDAGSGPVSGAISYREVGDRAWTEIPTEARAGTGARGGAGAGMALVASLPRGASGSLVLRAVAGDAAGNLAAASARRVLRPVPARSHRGHRGSTTVGSPTSLLAWIGGGRGGGSGATVDFGAEAVLHGRLVDRRGRGLGGERLRVVARPRRGGAPTHAESVATGDSGRFELGLAPGSSRLLLVSFRGDRSHAATRAAPVRLTVRSGVTLRAAPSRLRTGESVEFHGWVSRGRAEIPRRGKLVTIQYLERATGRWRPAMLVRSDRHGAFAVRYRFRYVTGRAEIRLRATVLPEERWPYAAGSSDPLTLEVHG